MVIARCRDVWELTSLFMEAAETERKMPAVMRKRYRVAWPEYLPDPGLAYGYNETEVRLGPATSAEVSRWDVALELTKLWDAEDARLVWAVAHSAVGRQRGPAWGKVARLMRCHPATVKRRFERAMLEMWYKMLGEC